MKKHTPTILIIAAITLFVATASTGLAADGPRYAHTGPTLITDIRVINGLGYPPMEHQDILVVDGAIAAIRPTGSIEAPAGALKIDGSGMTAMPGLIDMHVHINGGWANGTLPEEEYQPQYDDESVQRSLSGHLYAGVTTILDTGSERPEWTLEIRNQIRRGERIAPRTFIVGPVWTQTPSGWGGDAPTVVTDLESIPDQMKWYVDNDIEIIKLYTGMSPQAAQFVVAEAHKNGIQTIADFWKMNMDTIIMEATGLDGYAHSSPQPVSADNNQWMAENDRFVIVTADVGEMLSGMRVADEDGSRAMLQEPLIVDIWGEDTVNEFYDVYPRVREYFYDGPESFYQQNNFGDMTKIRANFFPNIKGAYDAGVLIAGGSDFPYPSLWAGEAMHRELELLVMASIPAIDAIKICSYNASKILERDDEFGSLQEGLSADILIVEGNPATNISDSRNVKYVFLMGKLVDRKSLTLGE
jgi:imidazolonepropionase-like amidohydrolase